MRLNKMAGACLILLGVVNVLHEVALRSAGRGTPGFGYAFATALFFTIGTVFFFRRSASQNVISKTKEPLIFKD